MAIRREVKRTDFYFELNEQERSVFAISDKKFLHNIDTFYYSIFLSHDNNYNSRVEILLRKLQVLKEQIRKDKKRQPLPFVLTFEECGLYDFDTGFNLTMKHFAIYEYCLTINDMFDVFISDYLPNNSTPRIVVQLRSYGLWLHGIDYMLDSSFKKVKKILDVFDIEVDSLRENRIDYCYHTNYIQDAFNFFSDKRMVNNMHTNLDKYHKIGNIYKGNLTLDYLALGQRKSNNLFIRIYNKSREVIEEGYKSFFFAVWKKNGLISEYDLFCYEYAFSKGSFNALDEARLKYYLLHGKDDKVKREIDLTLKDKNVQYQDVLKLANSLMPKVTVVMNIEFQTKRKFYFNAQFLNSLPVFEEHKNIDLLVPLFQIVDNRKIILDYLTSSSLKFYTGDKYEDWWSRLRGTKIRSLKCDSGFVRSFNYKCDKLKVAKRTVNMIASNAVYKHKVNTDFVDDISDFLGFINDNDDRVYNIVGYDKLTGECLDFIDSDLLEEYKVLKEKKYKAVKNRLSTSE